MNRKKKINQILKKKLKKANAKANPGNKTKYISKAEREAEAQPPADAQTPSATAPREQA
ncbi:DUF2986 domain-containing protein [Ferrimonas gelatinilytica]|uniref:DUF2986 domain-containing protein n=1 Tax=Ferrimonas gelatinilytica TaxID=1255257 RepID=A0ABP9S810_9GAMM